MKIAVIGTFILDTIITLSGQKTESFGGISYSISALANLLSNEDYIYPVANVGYDAFDRITDFLSPYENVHFDGLNKESRPNTRVTLKYHTKESRDEFLTYPLSPLRHEQLTKLGDFDVVLINFITGFELPIEELHKIFSSVRALFYMDYHSLCLGIDEHGKRYPRKPQNWKQWLTGVDILQLNQHEATVLSENGEFDPFCQKLISQGIQIINITLGSEGSVLYTTNENKLDKIKIPAYAVDNVIDVTGCGDAFSAAFIAKYLLFRNAIGAAEHANKIAGVNSTISGIENISRLAAFKI